MGSNHAVVPETIAEPTVRVRTGRLDEDASYRTIRRGGTTDWLVIVTVAGRGRLRTPSGEELASGPGEITVIEPHTPHDYGTDPRAGAWELCWAHLEPRPDWRPLLDWPRIAPGIGQLKVERAVRDRVISALDRGTATARLGLAQGPQLAMNAVEEALLWCDTQNPRRTVLDPRLLLVLEHVGQHLDQPHTMTSLARIGGLSATRLAHLAHDQLGSGLITHLHAQRIDLARQLLTLTDLPVSSIAERVGYPDPLYFSRRFRAATGMSPTGYRSV